MIALNQTLRATLLNITQLWDFGVNKNNQGTNLNAIASLE